MIRRTNILRIEKSISSKLRIFRIKNRISEREHGSKDERKDLNIYDAKSSSLDFPDRYNTLVSHGPN